MQRSAANESASLLLSPSPTASCAVPIPSSAATSNREGPGSEMMGASYSAARIAMFQAAFVLLSATLALVWRWQSTIIVDETTGRKLSNPVSQAVLVVGLFPLLEFCRYVHVTRYFATPRADTGEPVRRVPGVNCPTEDFGWLAAAPLGSLQALMNLCVAVVSPHVGATVVQVLRSSKLPFAAVISFTLLGRRYSNGKVSGVVLLAVGALCTAFTTPGQHHSRGNGDESLVMMVIIFLVSLISAVRSVFEERVMDRYMATELDLVGKEGTVAFLVCAAFALLCVAMPASWGMPDPRPFWGDVQASPAAIWSTVILAILNPLKASVGLGVTKLTSAVAMIATGQARVLVVAFVSAVALNEHFSAYQFVGYALILLGLATYFGMVSVGALFRPSSSAPTAQNLAGIGHCGVVHGERSPDSELSRLESVATMEP